MDGQCFCNPGSRSRKKRIQTKPLPDWHSHSPNASFQKKRDSWCSFFFSLSSNSHIHVFSLWSTFSREQEKKSIFIIWMNIPASSSHFKQKNMNLVCAEGEWVLHSFFLALQKKWFCCDALFYGAEIAILQTHCSCLYVYLPTYCKHFSAIFCTIHVVITIIMYITYQTYYKHVSI